jgi:hypothetical protein
MRILLVGHGKMGRMVEGLAADYCFEVAGIVDPVSPRHGGGPDADRWAGVDVAVDFSTPASVPGKASALAARGINMVIGTTGWSQHEPAVREAVARGGVGVVVAPNFSTGVVLFDALAAYAATLFGPHEDFGAFLHEAHHAAKLDAPSGTALLLKRRSPALRVLIIEGLWGISRLNRAIRTVRSGGQHTSTELLVPIIEAGGAAAALTIPGESVGEARTRVAHATNEPPIVNFLKKPVNDPAEADNEERRQQVDCKVDHGVLRTRS